MSPALVQKYLDAARRVADHILFLPGGFSFAPYPVVTDEDRDKYARQPHRRFLQAPAAGLRRLLSRRVALSPPRCAAPAAHDAGGCGDRTRRSASTYLNRVWTMLTARRRRRRSAGGAAGALAGPAAARRSQRAEGPASAVEWMRDLIVGLRPRVAMSFDNLPARGIAAGSQPLVLWKDRQYADHRTSYAGNAQATGSVGVRRRPIRCCCRRPQRRRARDTRMRSRASARCSRISSTSLSAAACSSPTPREIASDAEGHRLLSAGFHSQMGYFRDDRPLYELVLDQAQQRAARRSVEGARFHHARAGAAVQAVHLVRACRAAKLHGHRRSSTVSAPRTTTSPPRRRSTQLAERLSGQGARGDQ